MAISTFDELCAKVASWINRGDLTAIIPDFVMLAEKRLNRESKLRTRQAVANEQISISEVLTDLPADFGALININHAGETHTFPLVSATLQYLDTTRAQSAPYIPLYYAINGTQIEVAPTPNGTYPMALSYYTTIPALSADAPTNWLLTSAPDIYLRATLVEAWSYLLDDAQAAANEQRVQQLLDAYKRDSDAVEAGGAPMTPLGEPIGGYCG